MNPHMSTSSSSGQKIREFIRRNQMAIFILLTLLISWASVIPAEGGLLPQGPMIAAFIVLAVVSGRRGVSDLWQRMTRWRVGWKWYLIAPGILVAAHLFALLVSVMLGAEIVTTAHLQSLPALSGLLVPLLIFGGWWEEPGWIGYAYRRFEERITQSPLTAAFVTGLIRMFWHTPLLLYGKIVWYDYIFVSFALQFIFTWLYNRSGGSVLIPMICHLFSNLLFSIMYPLFDGVHQERYWILLVIAESLIALGLVIMTRGKLGTELEQDAMLAFDL